MKKQSNKRGFALLVLVAFIAVIGIETVILSGISSTMASETNQAYLRACHDNLVISGLTWAKTNADRGAVNEATDLDIASLALRRAELKVTVSVAEAGRKEANIIAWCSVARQRLRTDSTYDF
jgi:hypothetical protein